MSTLRPFSRQYSCARNTWLTSERSSSWITRAIRIGRAPETPCAHSPDWPSVHGAIEWEPDRVRFIGRGRTPEAPLALDGRALSGTTGAGLDPGMGPRCRG